MRGVGILAPQGEEVVKTILDNGGGLFRARARERFHQEKAWKRLQARPDWHSIYQKFELERLKRFDPRAYEVRLLRDELAVHKKKSAGTTT